ncbi:hypothetical protein P7C71_g3024, partial [Lecanoromycetidae sp. Uapishka_2]
MNENEITSADHMSPAFRVAEAIINACDGNELYLLNALRDSDRGVGAAALVKEWAKSHPLMVLKASEEKRQADDKELHLNEKVLAWVQKLEEEEPKAAESTVKPSRLLLNQEPTMDADKTAPDGMSAEYRAAEAIIDASGHEDLRLFNAPARLNLFISAGELVEKFEKAKGASLDETKEHASPSTKELQTMEEMQTTEKVQNWLRTLEMDEPQMDEPQLAGSEVLESKKAEASTGSDEVVKPK